MEFALKTFFENVFVHEKCKDSKVAKRVENYFGHGRIQWVKEKPKSDVEGRLSPREFEQSKRNLYVCEFEGSFFKVCPGAQNVACCNYYVLNLGLQCNMNCSYCYLQSYINSPLLTLYSNVDSALNELEKMGEKHRDLPLRVGTGEVMDSLSLDEITLYSRDLIQFFSNYPKWTLEFKTKSNKVDQFLDLSHSQNVIVSWSINPENIINSEEHGTARLNERFLAARKCVEHGYRVAFHMDPMIWHPEWQESYASLVDSITARFVPEEMPHISLGALRFQPQQRHMMRERFGFSSLVNRGEMFLSRDGKMRYDQELRNTMFNFVLKRFHDNNPKWKVWLCMESPESWVATFSETPRKVPELENYFRPLPNPKTVQAGGLR